MRGSVRRLLAVCLVLCCVTGLAASPVALGEGSSSGEGSGASSSLGGGLVTPGSPTEGEQAQAADEAKRSSPEAVAAREESQTKYENLNGEQAARVTREAFPAVVNEPAGGPPKLPAGQRITGYPTDNAAQIDLPEGKHGLIESLEPIAVETGPGSMAPVNLSLAEAGGAFEPKTPIVPVRIAKKLGEGVSLGSTGVSLTPVDEHGTALGGSEGAVDGASVFYANTQTDTDTLVKPTALGFETYTVLRSVESPQELYFRVGLPEGASFVEAKDGSGAIEIVREGARIATILNPGAHDATGTSVPVSMSISGNTLTLSVADHSGEYQYPIVVDPYAAGKDTQLTGNGAPTNWFFCMKSASEACTQKTETLSPFHTSGWGGTEGLSDEATGEYGAGAYAEFRYKTQGESQIYEVNTTTEATNNANPGSNMESSILLKNETGTINSSHLFSAENYGSTEYDLGECTNCTPIENHNSAVFQQSATAAGAHFHDRISSAVVHIRQEVKPTIAFDTTDEHFVIGGHEYTNVLAGKGAWLGPNSGALGFTIDEKGIGTSKFHFSEGNVGENIYYEQNLLSEGKCSGIQCPEAIKQEVTYNSKMANGEHAVYVYAQSAIESFEENGVEIKVDSTPPTVALTGLPASGVINEAQYHLQVQATDGSGTTASSGVKSIGLYLDGFEVSGGKSGSCTPGPCTAIGEWTINGEAFGAGKHTLTVQAIDNAGNVEDKPYSITVRHASPLPVGPGSVDPITGALHLGASDVSISGGIGSLGVSRGYNSRQLTAGEQGPLGPQWSLNISGSRGVEQEPTGSVVLIGSDGERTTFESNSKGGYISPKGDENLVLEAEKEGEIIKAYLLKDPAAGTTVKYTQPGGAGPWVIASSEGTLSKTNGGRETVEWERVENVTRPKLALAPVASGVTCSKTVKEPKELAVGCRALSFTYATETTATGEASSQWKAYKGRLMTVSFTAYNPSTKVMETKAVAEYAYDKQGRLRAESDPRITPSPLKTTYGYDGEGHVVAVNAPGEEPWLIHYGTTASDTSAGRLLSVTRPPAGTSAQVKERDEDATPEDTAVPTLSSTSPVVGATLSVASNGSWNNSPLAYSYSWEECKESICTVIPGAVNGTYTPLARNAGYTLEAQVTAVNADGATVATTAASKTVSVAAPVFLRSFGSAGTGKGQFKGPAGIALDSSGNVWVVDHGNSRIEKWSAGGEYQIEYSTFVDEPAGIAINQSTGDVYVVDTGENIVVEFNSKGELIGLFGSKGKEPGELDAPRGIAIAPNGNVWVGDYGNNRVAEFSETGKAIGDFGSEGTGNGQFKGPDGIAFSGGDAYVVDSGNDRVQEFSTSGQYIAKFGSKGTSNGEFEVPYGIATEPVSGDLYVVDSGNDRVEEFSPAGAFLVAFGKKGTGNGEFTSPEQVAVNTAGDVYVSDTGNNRVQELEPKYSTSNPLPEPPALGTSAVTTIDYNVPLSGSGAPHEMTTTELEKWGQTDDPAEPAPGQSLATAVFPPDEPMGWPAKDYKRATITYLDELGRTVNRAVPSAGIATSEYNETNEVIRSLSADNREAALKEGAKSKEASELLDTKSKYNGETKAEKEAEEKAEKETGFPA
jgi:DNA-binding beta-propeller fold protein YncE